MRYIITFSDYLIPVVILLILGIALYKGVNCFDVFLEGAADGMRTCVGLLPSLIGLMVGVGLMRASGVLKGISNCLKPVAKICSFPAQVIPLVIVKLFSTSAAISILIDLFKQFGPDSGIGFLGSVIMCPTETIMYILAIYFGSFGIKNTRYVIPGALIVCLVGTIVSAWIVYPKL